MNELQPNLENSTTEAGPRKRHGRGLLIAAAGLAILVAVGLGWGIVALSGGPSTPAQAAASTGVTQPGSSSDQSVALSGAGGLPVSPAELVATKLGPSVVNIKVSVAAQATGQPQYAGEGSGVIYSAEGFILTNNHVVTLDGTQSAVELDVTLATGQVLPATIIGTDPLTDLAVIKVTPTSQLPVATFVNAGARVGEYAIALGSPLGYANSVTLGIVSGIGRTLDGVTGEDSLAYVDLIQTDAAISPGNSGGALADSQGQVIGINVAYLPPAQTGAENVGFAIPAETATRIADQLIKTGKASHVYLGVSTQTITPDLAKQFGLGGATTGALVAEVSPNGPAGKAGIKQGDVITKIDNETVTSGSDVLVALRGKLPGDAVRVTIDRSGVTQVISVVVQERPTGV